MKYKTTNKEVKNGYNHVIIVPDGSLQRLLSCENAVAYNAGVYGWNYDVYDIGGGVCIVQGYRPFGKLTVDYDVCKEYDKLANDVCNSVFNYEDKKARLRSLIDDFVKEVLSK